jgi:hypothetical protein
MGSSSSKTHTRPKPLSKTQQTQMSRAIDRSLRKSHEQSNNNSSLVVIMGPRGSGQTTVFKNLMMLYGNSFSKEDYDYFKLILHNNIICTMKILLEEFDINATHLLQLSELRGLFFTFDVSFESTVWSLSESCLLETMLEFCPEHVCVASLDEPSLTSKAVVEALHGDEEISSQLAQHLQRLWTNPLLQDTFKYCGRFDLSSFTSYFMDRIGECASPSFRMSREDILYTKTHTSSIAEFTARENGVKIVDASGMSGAESIKWLHQFSDATTVVFVIAVSDYDEVDEDENGYKGKLFDHYKW